MVYGNYERSKPFYRYLPVTMDVADRPILRMSITINYKKDTTFDATKDATALNTLLLKHHRTKSTTNYTLRTHFKHYEYILHVIGLYTQVKHCLHMLTPDDTHYIRKKEIYYNNWRLIS